MILLLTVTISTWYPETAITGPGRIYGSYAYTLFGHRLYTSLMLSGGLVYEKETDA